MAKRFSSLKNPQLTVLAFLSLILLIIVASLLLRQKYFELEPSPQSSTALSKTKSLTEWKTYSNEEWGITFEYPPDMEVSLRRVKDGTTIPSELLEVGPLLTLYYPYSDRLQTEYYIQNRDLIDSSQTELANIKIENIDYPLSKMNWSDGHPSLVVENCLESTDQPIYFVDIPSKISINIAFQTRMFCDPIQGQLIEKRLSGDPFPDFNQRLTETYKILSTLRFTR